MTAFTTPADYRAMYDTDATDERLTALIAKASRMIAAQLRPCGIVAEERGIDYIGLLSDITCDVVHRSLGDEGAENIPYGASQFGETTGSVSWNFSMSNPYGDMFLTANEKKMLGIGRSAARSIPAGNRGNRSGQ